jgi:hypothetical protein
MRASHLISVAIILFLVVDGHAQSGTTQTILVPEVEVRSGPSLAYYATTVLKQGDRVQPVELEPKTTGWLAIRPTRMDFSWVDARFVEQRGATAIVKAPEGALLWVGRRPVQQSPTVHARDPVPQGTILSVADRPWTGPEGITWLPVAPYQTEVRYLPESAVKPASPVETTVAAAPAAAQTTAAPRAPALSPRLEQLTDQAEKADRAGNFAEAIQLYQQVAHETPDESQRVRAANRAQYLQNQLAAMAPPTGALAASFPAPGSGQVGSQYCYTPDRYSTAQSRSPANATLTAPATPAGQWYGPATIRRAPFDVDGRPTYRVEPRDLSKQMWWYATAGPGVNFEPYVDRPNAYVYAFGPMTYRTDIRIWYMNALRVEPAR